MTNTAEQAYLPLMKKMLDVLAHDIRNPLNNILLSTAQFKMEALPDKDDTEFYIDIIERNCDRVNQLLAELLNSLHAPLLSIQEGDVNDLLKEVMAEFEDQLSLKNIRYTIKQKAAEKVQFDKASLITVFKNIIANAIEAMPQGGELELHVMQNEDHTTIDIKDTGTGISEAVLPQIFAPFFTTKERHRGLGLSEAKNIIVAHKGALTVEQSTKGAAIRLTIPKQNVLVL